MTNDSATFLDGISITRDLARQIIEATGGEQDDDGRWVFPDDFTTWDMVEATQYALEALPTVVFDAL